MSSLSLRLPDSFAREDPDLAARDDVSINQFIATAVAEKAAALLTVSYLEDRARRADAGLFDQVLARVPTSGRPETSCPQRNGRVPGRCRRAHDRRPRVPLLRAPPSPAAAAG